MACIRRVFVVAFTMLGRVSWWDVPSTVVLMAVGIGIYTMLKANLGSMRRPVIVYIAVISLMVSRAASTLSSPVLDTEVAVMIAVGAVLFYVSDMILAATAI